ncbi:hypothetical protein CAC42_5670 [Sphaceloma murrayae]|uniref:Apple domain-containing protein n=1 Tax=Sphaceloma murrayae TaxID=2082308 RepID=A0A2K1QZ04_9PEZI|nr:hypothetical protein CAC42_5670 [Sphaceloma murrayae]
MKVTSLALSAVALVPAVAAGELEVRAGKKNNAAFTVSCTTVAAQSKYQTTTPVWPGTTFSTRQDRATVKSTVFTPVTSTTTSTLIKRKKTQTNTVTNTVTVSKTNTVTVTATFTGKARTISPDPTTSTIATPSGFVPAASALASVNAKRDAQNGGNKKATICIKSFFAQKTQVIDLPKTTITNTVTKPGKTTNYITETQTVTKAGTETTVVTTTTTKTRNVAVTASTSTTVTPIVTLAPRTVKLYSACAEFNLLDYTLSSATATPDNSTDTGDDDSSDGTDDGDYSYSKRMRRSARLVAAHNAIKRSVFPKMKIARRALNHVGINAVAAGSGITAVDKDDIDSAYDCCAACQETTNCVGSSYSVDGCTVYTGTTCPASQASTAGTFTFDSADLLAEGDGEIVSNGKCGTWQFGGDSAGSSDDTGNDDTSDDA